MSLLGGLLGGAFGLLGNSMSNTAADNAADEAWDRTKKVLTNQVQWRVKDTIKAGLHPLAALGVNPASGPAPAQVGMDLGSTLGSMGQDIGRAAEAMMAPESKTAAAMTRLSLERAQLENDLIRSQITSQRVRTVREGTPGVPGNLPGNPGPATSMNLYGLSSDPNARLKLPLPETGYGQRAEDELGEGAGSLLSTLYTWDAMNKEFLNGGIVLGAPEMNRLGNTLGAPVRDYYSKMLPPAESNNPYADYMQW